MGTTQKSIFEGDRFFRALKAGFLAKAAESLTNKGYTRAGNYVCPSRFYNHGSKTFLKNKRRGL